MLKCFVETFGMTFKTHQINGWSRVNWTVIDGYPHPWFSRGNQVFFLFEFPCLFCLMLWNIQLPGLHLHFNFKLHLINFTFLIFWPLFLVFYMKTGLFSKIRQINLASQTSFGKLSDRLMSMTFTICSANVS